jgi:hypothetical protein
MSFGTFCNYEELIELVNWFHDQLGVVQLPVLVHTICVRCMFDHEYQQV